MKNNFNIVFDFNHFKFSYKMRHLTVIEVIYLDLDGKGKHSFEE